MKIRALIALLRAKYANIPEHQKPIVLLLTGLLGMILVVFFFKLCISVFFDSKHTLNEPMLIRKENKIIVPKNSPIRKEMKIQRITTSREPHQVSFPANIEAEPSQITQIFPPITGRLTKYHVKLGDVVKKDQILAVIEAPGLSGAKTDQDKARSAYILAKEALKRARQVNRAGANAIKDIESAESNYIIAQAELKRATATVNMLGKHGFRHLQITSPINGVITSLNYGQGSFINDLTIPIFTVYNTNFVWVVANIPEKYISSITKNLPVEITLFAIPKRVFKGKISYVNPYMEGDTRRNKVHIELLHQDDKLMPNMYATAKISLPEPKEALIPISAILMHNDATSVFVEIQPWTFERRDVDLGTEDHGNVRVISGLSEGDRVVTHGGVLVND